MQTQRKELNFNGQNIYPGIDGHLKSWQVSVMIENIMFKTFVQPACPKTLHQYLTKNFPGGTYHSAYEAGFCGFWAHNELIRFGVKSIIASPSDIPTTGKEKVQKTDARDSRKIVRSLRNGDLNPIYIPSVQTLHDRSLIRMRSTLVGDLTKTKQRIKSFLYFHGISLPPQFLKAGTHWSKQFMKWLKEITIGPPADISLNILLTHAENLRVHLLSVNRQVRILSQNDRYSEWVGLLRSVPGIGLITAMVLLTELESITRFINNDDLCAYIGIVPSTHDSGTKESRRKITSRGHHVLRKMMIESAWVAIRVDPALSKSYIEYCKRMEPNKAIVRIAKKLLSRIKYVLTNKKKYELCKVK